MLSTAPLLCALVTALTMGGTHDLKTGIRGIDLAAVGGIRAEALVSPETHWGNEHACDETAVDPSSQYNGRVYDPATGFHDYGARLYWPQIGRFVSVDPAGIHPENPQSWNRYAYVSNNP